jgi:hypothetical protein
MPDAPVHVQKEKFDALLKQMIKTPPLPKADIVTPRSRKKRGKK